MPATNHDFRRTIVFTPELLAKIQARAPRIAGGLGTSQAVGEALTNYFAILDHSRREVANQFSQAEMNFLCDILNGSFRDATLIANLAMEVEESLEDGYAEKWGVEGQALARKIYALPYAHKVALVEAVEEFWSEQGG